MALEITVRKLDGKDDGPQWLAIAQHPDGYPIAVNEWTEFDALMILSDLLEVGYGDDKPKHPAGRGRGV